MRAICLEESRNSLGEAMRLGRTQDAVNGRWKMEIDPSG
jgi:hypothetical protein